MKSIILLFFITFSLGTTFSQTTDSLNIFPNPFATTTTIHFEIVEQDTITLRVINLSGQIVKTYFQETVLPSGSYNINVLDEDLEFGYYLVLLKIGSTKSITKKAFKTNSVNVTDMQVNTKGLRLLFPNPISGNLTIPIDGIKTVVITDLNGKTLKSLTTNQYEISLSEFSAGEYLVTVFSNKNEVIIKQIISKTY
ncbi:MAG TPA: T9SS type A sorting domain-containing protein [Crocinitomicaceae bacterium]|nr:T9SS type A sorting domain-containing protein [Crocinitomicaceae bacterium]